MMELQRMDEVVEEQLAQPVEDCGCSPLPMAPADVSSCDDDGPC